MKVEWSADSLADLDRFAAFLHEHHPGLAKVVAREIVEKSQLLSQHSEFGRPLAGRNEYRQLVLRLLNAYYVFQYPLTGERIVILRVFHGRETRP